MHDSNDDSRATAISILLINLREAKNIETLKRFLAFIPDPRHTQNILTDAILQTLERSTETCCWLLHHPDPFKPEINVTEIITRHLSQTLEAYGCLSGQHFQFDDNGNLEMNSDGREQLRAIKPRSSDEIALTLIFYLIDNKI
jgi:hypothetical protein